MSMDSDAADRTTSSALRVRPPWPSRSGPQAFGRLPIGVVLAAVLVGAIQRWWVAAHPIGTLSSDGAVIGLMALRLLHHGQLTAYMWGQSYGGSLEAVLTAAVFAVAGRGTSQLLATTALSSALCAIALWRAGRHIVGEPAAQIGALAFWVWPASFLWRSLKPGGTYMVGLAIALCAVGALARIRQGDDGWPRALVEPDVPRAAHPGRALVHPRGQATRLAATCDRRRGDRRGTSDSPVRCYPRLGEPAHAGAPR